MESKQVISEVGMDKYRISRDKYNNYLIYVLNPRGNWAICGSRETLEDAKIYIDDHRNR